MQLTDSVHLLLNAPGQAPADLPASAWRSWVLTDRGPLSPQVVAQGIRLSPVTGRAERALVAALAADDVDGLARLVEAAGPVQDAARVLYGLRQASSNPSEALAVLGHVVAGGGDPTASKVLRRHLPSLHVHVALAPGVPALAPVDRVGVALVLADLLVEHGRAADALRMLEAVPATPSVVLTRTATLLAHGDHKGVLDATVSIANVDDVSALALIARSVAARSLNDLSSALDATCAALADASRGLGVIAAALEERAQIYTLSGDHVAAQNDLAALASVADGALRIEIPEPSPLRRHVPDISPEHSLDRARHRMRRRIAVGSAPGTFGGRHHSTYRDEIAQMFSLGQIVAVEELLLGLLDVVEDEVDELHLPLDSTFFLTLADLYQDSGRTEDLKALRERFHAAELRAQQNAADAAAEAEDPVAVEAAPERAPELEVPAPGWEPAAAAVPELVGAAPAPPATAGSLHPTARATTAVEWVVEPGAPAGEGSSAPPAEGDRTDVAALADALATDAPVTDREVDAAVEVARGDGVGARRGAAPDDEPADGDADGDDPADQAGVEPGTAARPMTLVERTIRGPRVRSL